LFRQVVPGELALLTLTFETKLIHWKGPSPFFFAPVPDPQGAEIRRISKFVTYGWGVIPVEAEIGGVRFRTSLFPKDETYLLPVKVDVRRRAGITEGDTVSVSLRVQSGRN
jgi:hypothetical protein